MTHRRTKHRLVVNYDNLGTISERELIDALIDDLEIMKEKYGVKFYKGGKLLLTPSDEYGSPLNIKRSNGSHLKRFDSTHYRPACLDYE